MPPQTNRGAGTRDLQQLPSRVPHAHAPAAPARRPCGVGAPLRVSVGPGFLPSCGSELPNMPSSAHPAAGSCGNSQGSDRKRHSFPCSRFLVPLHPMTESTLHGGWKTCPQDWRSLAPSGAPPCHLQALVPLLPHQPLARARQVAAWPVDRNLGTHLPHCSGGPHSLQAPDGEPSILESE